MKNQFNMKKISLILLIVMVGSFLIAGIGFRITGGISHFINGNGVAQEIDEVKYFDIEGVDNINIDVTSTNVDIIPTDDSQVKVHFHGEVSSVSLKSRFELDAIRNNNTIDIDIISNSFTSISFGSMAYVNVKLDIYVPKNYDKNILIDSTSSDVKINNLSLNNLTNETTSGNLIIDKVNTVKTRVKTTSGDIVASEFNGDLDVKSTSGNINIDYENFENEIKIETVSGEVELNLEKESKFYLKAKTTSGDINCNYPITINNNVKKNVIEGNVGDSDNSIVIKTTSGDIDINN